MAKRLIFITVFLLFGLLVFVYAIIPSVITVTKTASVKCIDENVLLLLANKEGWKKWMPGEGSASDRLHYKGYQFNPGTVTYTSVNVEALVDDDIVPSLISFVKDSVTKTRISFSGVITTGINPVSRFRKWQLMKKYEIVIGDLLQQLTSFAEDRKNIYGIAITDGKIPDSLFISTRKTFSHLPTANEIYTLIDGLKTYAAENNATQVNPPMMHLEQLDSVTFEIMVALPIDRAVNSNGSYLFKQMVKGNTLIAEVKGGRASINSGLKALEQFKSDYQFTSPAISFELMITDRRAEPDTAKWITRLYHPIF